MNWYKNKGAESDIVLSTRIRLARNLKDYPFPERLSEEKWTAQLVTGFTLAGLDAVYSVRGEEGLLSARAGDRIYMLRAPVDEQALYVLGAGAYLE